MIPTLYHGTVPISPHRQESKSRADLTATKMKELAKDVQDAVEEDFPLHCRVTDTDEFLTKLLPVENATLDKILQYMKNEKRFYNSQTQRWKGFFDPTQQPSGSKKTPKENSLYGPFCAIAEAIREFLENRCSCDPEMGNMKWMDYHSNSPRSQDSQAAQLRPDILLAFQAIAGQTELKETRQPQQEGGKSKKQKKRNRANRKEKAKEREDEVEAEVEGQKKENEQDNLQLIWWLQLIAAVEMKRADQGWADVFKQLFGYLRRILREQLDRRFVFGLTLGPDMMTVWLHDRSGVIGTKLAINIHKEPLKFIQVISAFSLLPPEKLGFDPTIEMLVSPNHAVPSYKPNEEFIKAYEAARHNRQWVIKMNDGSKYVTVETVSSVRAGFMRGRGGIVWVVVPFDRANEESKVLVLKQSWRPREVESEGDLYDKSECDFVGKIERCEEVLISRKPDATDTLIRNCLDDSISLGKRTRDQLPESRRSDEIHVKCTDVGDIKEVVARETGSPVARVRTRVVLSTYGWLIKYFSTRRELLVVLRDAIKGHKYLYERGVLHRDISPGNILIKWRPGCDVDQPSTSGCLIDLDHAKKGKPFSGLVTARPADKDDVDFALLWCSMKGVEPDVAHQALTFFPAIYAIVYLDAALANALRFRPLNGQLCTRHHLGWKEATTLYNFEFTERRGGSRTGTPPYTSGEILSARRYFSNLVSKVFHDAVHDLESFFWVLVHICMTRQGPGGVRREELEQENQDNEDYEGLRRVVYCFFDSEDNRMAENKAEIFTHQNHLEQYVLGNFHDYFRPLQELVKEWYHLLILAHKFHAFEYHNIHDMVLEILDRAVDSAPPEDIDERAQKVLDDRKANIEKLLDGNSFGKVQQSPPPHTSPMSQRVTQCVHRSQPSSPTPAPKKWKMLHVGE